MELKIETWVIVLVKEFGSAKQRLQPALSPAARHALARRNATLAITAAKAGDHVLVVAGAAAVAEMAEAMGVEALREPSQEGQNVAAGRGIRRAMDAGAQAVLVLSSDLPLVTSDAVAELLQEAAQHESPVAIAVPAVGRGGTNALYLRPPHAIGLHFGNDSLAQFRDDAAANGVRFAVHHSEAMALDLDEPSDLVRLRRAV